MCFGEDLCVLVRIWSMMQREVSPIELSEQGLKSKGLYRCGECTDAGNRKTKYEEVESIHVGR